MDINEHDDVCHAPSSTVHHHESLTAISSHGRLDARGPRGPNPRRSPGHGAVIALTDRDLAAHIWNTRGAIGLERASSTAARRTARHPTSFQPDRSERLVRVRGPRTWAAHEAIYAT